MDDEIVTELVEGKTVKSFKYTDTYGWLLELTDGTRIGMGYIEFYHINEEGEIE